MSRTSFNQLRHAFAHKMTLHSEWVTLRRIEILSGIKPVKYDCCIKSCIAYTEKYKSSLRCPICKEPRFTNNGRPRWIYYYLPLIPCLQAFFQNVAMIEKLSYCDNYVPSNDEIRDVFDAQHYRTLRNENVEIDGVQRPYKYFSGKHDIALSVCKDRHCVFRHCRNGPSATPIVLQIYNLPPRIRAHLSNLICVGIIPDHPSDMASFLAPLDEELTQLAFGVQTFNAQDLMHFLLQAYIILVHGDLLVIAKMLGIKGHNGYSPCRSCKIKGVRNIPAGSTTYYTPLTTPDVQHQTRPDVDPRNLEKHQHSDFCEVLDQLAAETRKNVRKWLAMFHGIREAAALTRVKSINYARSIAWDWMHLSCENVIPKLHELWAGRFKHLKSRHFNYVISPENWKEIGRETTESVKSIPASFVRVLGDISQDQSRFTAKSWAFWFVYVAPIVLKDRFPKTRYYKHMLSLVKIMKTTLKYEITHKEIDDLEEEIICWVEKYEKYVTLSDRRTTG